MPRIRTGIEEVVRRRPPLHRERNSAIIFASF
jgi:hypothetical protein